MRYFLPDVGYSFCTSTWNYLFLILNGHIIKVGRNLSAIFSTRPKFPKHTLHWLRSRSEKKLVKTHINLRIINIFFKTLENFWNYCLSLNHRDPHVVMMALSVLDSCWSNCGTVFRREVSSASFISELQAKSTNVCYWFYRFIFCSLVVISRFGRNGLNLISRIKSV